MQNNYKIKYDIPKEENPAKYPIEKIHFEVDRHGAGDYVVLWRSSPEFGKTATLCTSGDFQFTPEQLRDMADGFVRMADNLDKHYK